MMLARLAFPVALAIAILGSTTRNAAQTAPVLVQNDISVSTTWTADNTYLLVGQIVVAPGATLTIEAGTVVFSSLVLSGSLVVGRGAGIDVQGTVARPVVFTSTSDIATWSADPTHPAGGDPRSGVWREVAGEIGVFAVAGSAYIAAADRNLSNLLSPDPGNEAQLPGFVPQFPGDRRGLFGGGDDDDDSGAISYLSVRYAGRVLSIERTQSAFLLAGVGASTDVHHIDVMNAGADGVGVLGGTVSPHHLSIWNVGDDCVDIDLGWRGRMQFVLGVQGYAQDGPPGTGVGDSGFEVAGASPSRSQPLTTGVVYNATIIGQPLGGGLGVRFLANGRMQFRNSIFMELGDQLFDRVGPVAPALGLNYGAGGTLSWAQTWQTPASFRPPVNAAPPGLPGYAGYPAQIDGNLLEFSDSVLFDNGSYTEAIAVGAVDPALGIANRNDLVFEPVSRPIRSIVRAQRVTRGGTQQLRVTRLDPRAINEATTSAGFAPGSTGLNPARYRGAVAPESSWLNGWTAADAFGFLVSDAFTDLGGGVAGALGAPRLGAEGSLQPGVPVSLTLSNCPISGSSAVVIVGAPATQPLGLFGLDLMVDLNGAIVAPLIPNATRVLRPPALAVGTALDFQAVVLDPSRSPDPLTTTNRLRGFWR